MNLLKRIGSVFNSRFENVGAVINAESVGAVHMYEAARPSPRPLLKRLQQIDRRSESETLRERVRSADRSKPLIAGLSGVRDDGMRDFLERFGEQELQKYMPDAREHLGLLPWPEAYFRSLVTDLMSKVSSRRPGYFAGRPQEKAELAEMIRGYGKTICFGHILKPSICLERPDILAEWAEFFGEQCANPAGGHLLICMLFIEVRDPRSADCRRLLELLDRLGLKHGFQPLMSFRLVEPDDLDNWIDAYNDDPEPDQIGRIPPDWRKEVFGFRNALRFEEVHRKLSAKLKIDDLENPSSWRLG